MSDEMESIVAHAMNAFNYAMEADGVEFARCTLEHKGYVDDDASKVVVALLQAGWAPPKEIPQ